MRCPGHPRVLGARLRRTGSARRPHRHARVTEAPFWSRLGPRDGPVPRSSFLSPSDDHLYDVNTVSFLNYLTHRKISFLFLFLKSEWETGECRAGEHSGDMSSPQPYVSQRGRVRAVSFTMLRPWGGDQLELPRPCLHYGGAAADHVPRG